MSSSFKIDNILSPPSHAVAQSLSGLFGAVGVIKNENPDHTSPLSLLQVSPTSSSEAEISPVLGGKFGTGAPNLQQLLMESAGLKNTSPINSSQLQHHFHQQLNNASLNALNSNSANAVSLLSSAGEADIRSQLLLAELQSRSRPIKSADSSRVDFDHHKIHTSQSAEGNHPNSSPTLSKFKF